ncbi:MAG TPA: AAA family ATPase [Crinalium sp.]|jgi:thymidylate kinase
MGESVTKPSQPLVIEFVGLPGAGKTTVFHQVVAQLREEGISVAARDEILKQWKSTGRVKKLLQLLPQTWNHVQTLVQSLVLASQVKPLNRQSFAKAVKVYTNVKRIDAIAQSRSHQLIVLDQGLLQEIWSVGITGKPPETKQIQRELSTLFQTRSVAIVDFNIDVETALQRIQQRPTEGSRFDVMESDAAQATLTRYGPYLQDILRCAQTLGIPLLEVDSALSVEEKAEKIVLWMHSLIRAI